MTPRIIGWHSYKGGSGRSLSLANMAYALAKRGHRIACIDLDLESSGLSEVFGVDTSNYASVTDLLIAPTMAALKKSTINLPRLLAWNELGQGTIQLLAAKHEGPEILDRVRWNPYTLTAFRDHVINLLARMEGLDYVFIDSRSGISQQLAASLMLGNDTIVVCSRLDRQSRIGTRELLEQIRRHAPSLVPLVLVTGVPTTDNAQLELAKYRNFLDQQCGIPPPSVFPLPFDPNLVLNEEIVTRTRPDSALAAAFENIASRFEAREGV